MNGFHEVQTGEEVGFEDCERVPTTGFDWDAIDAGAVEPAGRGGVNLDSLGAVFAFLARMERVAEGDRRKLQVVAWMVNPESFGNPSLQQLGERLGVSRATVNRWRKEAEEDFVDLGLRLPNRRLRSR